MSGTELTSRAVTQSAKVRRPVGNSLISSTSSSARAWPSAAAARSAELHGADGELEAVTLGSGERLPLSLLSLFLGARPCTEWLGDVITRDESGFILTGPGAAGAEYLLESTIPGVFAAGDVREVGAMAAQYAHARLAALPA